MLQKAVDQALVAIAHAEVVGDCRDAIVVWQSFLEHVNHLRAVTVLATLKHDFPGGGFSGVIIIGESHAAIHTWPELDRCFIELATCGDPSMLDAFLQFTLPARVTDNAENAAP